MSRRNPEAICLEMYNCIPEDQTTYRSELKTIQDKMLDNYRYSPPEYYDELEDEYNDQLDRFVQKHFGPQQPVDLQPWMKQVLSIFSDRNNNNV